MRTQSYLAVNPKLASGSTGASSSSHLTPVLLFLLIVVTCLKPLTLAAQEQLIFVAEWEGKSDIYRLMEEGVEQLTEVVGGTLFPSLSPDGKWLVYSTGIEGNAELVLMDSEEGVQNRLTKSVLSESETTWSPDSTRIAFVGGLLPPGGPNVLDDRDIFLMDIESRETHKIIDGPWSDVHPDWSPKTDQLVFQSDRVNREHDSIYLFDLETGGTRRLTPDGMTAGAPKWSPDGKQIAFFSRTSVLGTQPDLLWPQVWVRRLDGTVVDSFGVDNASNHEPDVSPDGQRIAFVARKQGEKLTGIYLYDRNTRQITQLTQPEEADHEPNWSPDGEHLIFVSRQGGNTDIWVMDANGEGQANLTRSEESERNPVWSPSGDQIAYARREADGSRHIYVMDMDGGNIVRVSATPGINASPTWSPEGNRIGYLNYADVDAPELFTIYVLDIQSLLLDPLYQGSGRVVRIDWSPDGRQIIFGRQRGRLGDIQVVDVAAGIAENLDPTPMGLQDAAWSPLGQEIVFSAHWSEQFEPTTGILFMDTEGNIHREIFPEMEPHASRGLAWSPDGQKMAYTTQVDGHLYVLDLQDETTEILVESAAYPCWRDPIRFLDVGPQGKLGTMWHAVRQGQAAASDSGFAFASNETGHTPHTTRLLRNYPNPCNPQTWIPYQLRETAQVTIRIHDVKGGAVRILSLGNRSAGVYVNRGRAAYWDGTNHRGERVASGVYYCTLQVGDFADTRQILVIR